MTDTRFRKALTEIDTIIRDWETLRPQSVLEATALNWRMRKIEIVRGVLKDLRDEVKVTFRTKTRTASPRSLFRGGIRRALVE